jgi:hypothetical protein
MMGLLVYCLKLMSHKLYKTEINKLTLNHGEPIIFEHPIMQSLLVENIILLVLEIPSKIIYNQNVFAVSLNGDLLWRIKPIDFFQKAKDCPYTQVVENGLGQVILFNWCDTAVVINPKTGEVLSKYHAK